MTRKHRSHQLKRKNVNKQPQQRYKGTNREPDFSAVLKPEEVILKITTYKTILNPDYRLIHNVGFPMFYFREADTVHQPALKNLDGNKRYGGAIYPARKTNTNGIKNGTARMNG